MFIPLRTMVLFAIVAEPVNKPDARFFCVRLGIASRTGKSIHFAGRSECTRFENNRAAFVLSRIPL
jgi:hypothetical protein